MFNKHTAQMRFISSILSVSLVFCGAFALSGCQTETEPPSTLTSTLADGATITSGILTVGVNASDTPYAGKNSSSETVGFDVDVAAALADELGLKLQIVDVNSNGRAALTNNQVDIALGVTKSGSDNTVTYSSAYIDDGASLYCLSKNKPKSISSVDLGKGKVLVQGQTTAAYTLQSALGIASIQTTSTLQDAFKALESGEQTYLVADAVIGDYFARDYSDVERVDFISSDAVSPRYAVTLTKNSELTSAVSDALNTISNNGVLRVISAKWLGSAGSALLPGQVDLSKLPKTALNK